MKIYLATDHAGFDLKEKIKEKLTQMGHNCSDCGAFAYDPEDDYPDFCATAAVKVASEPESLGIVIGKSGAGEAITANKIKGIRAFQAINTRNVKLAKEHNNANIMSLGAEFVNLEELDQLLKTFIETPFLNEERHKRRIEKISRIESESLNT